MDYEKMNKIIKTSLQEDTRTQLINKSKSSKQGMERYNKRNRSRVATSVREYNAIDMNKLFKDNILSVDVRVKGETDNYLVKISFGGFLDFLNEEISRRNRSVDLGTITRALVRGFNQDNVYIHCTCPDFCLHGSTKIALINGECDYIESLMNRVHAGESIFTYSVDAHGNFSPSQIRDIWVSGFSKEFTYVELETGVGTLTTPDHRYMLSNGDFVEARFLAVGDTLMGVGKTHVVKNVAPVCFEKEEPVYDINVAVNSDFMVESGAILHNCYRFAYWATRNKINSGEQQPSNGKWIRNPDDTLGSSCKHVLLVLSNNSWLIKVASVINNYIKYAQKNMKKAYADIIYPAIYKEKYEEPVQTSMFDSDELETEKDVIDASNEAGRTSGQFRAGNEYRFTPSGVNKDQMSINDTGDSE